MWVSDVLVFSLLSRLMLTQWRYVNDDWSPRPLLSGSGPLSSLGPSQCNAVNLAKTEGGYTLEKLYFIQVHIMAMAMAAKEYFPMLIVKLMIQV